MSNNACIALLLDGPMQSWGFTSRFTRRTTALHPTKSGIVGLLAAAMGIDKYGASEPDEISKLAGLRFTTITLPKQRHETELPTLRLDDYQTIGGGYKKGADSMKKPRAASGAVLETVLSERHYLLDARFGVLLEGPDDLLSQIAEQLQDPVWGVWLGRKCCVPAAPILVGIEAEASAAFRRLLSRAGYDETHSLEDFDHVVEGESAEEVVDSEWLNDSPVAFGAPIGERHGPRRIRHIRRK